MLLIVVLILVGSWAVFKAYRYYKAPHIEESQHYLYLNVDTTRNLTLVEGLGYGDRSEGKYVIIHKGGIYFYTLSPGLNLTREVEIANRAWYPVKVETTATGNITQFLSIDAPDMIKPKKSVTVVLTVSIPTENALAGDYRGNFTVKLIPKKT